MTSTNLELLGERAARHAEAGKWREARADWLDALAIDPESADVMLELSYVESLAGHYRVARDWALRAARSTPSSVESTLTLLQRLRTFNEASILHGLVAHLLGDKRTSHAVLAECARQLSNLNDFDLALRCAKAAMATGSGDLQTRLTHGQLLADHGRIEEAAEDFNWVLERNPRIAMAWWKLSRLCKQTLQSNHVAQLQALLATQDLALADVAAAARALHKELDDIGDVEGAWRALQTFCQAKRSTLRYDPMETRNLVDALVKWPSGNAMKPVRQLADKWPVFIVGMHRSGTTLLEQLLDANPQVRGIGELYDFTCEMRYATDHHCRIPIDATIVARAHDVDFTEVGRRYLDGVAWRLGAETHFTDKQPANFFNVGFICQALPQAKILHMVRDPVETCFSNLRELFSDVNRHSYDQLELADYFLQYRRLMAHWHEAYPGKILDVDYERLTADPETTMREVAAFIDVDFLDGMRSTTSSNRAVATASSIQVRDGVVRLATPKWAPYARQLQPLIQALQQGGIKVAGSMT